MNYLSDFEFFTEMKPVVYKNNIIINMSYIASVRFVTTFLAQPVKIFKSINQFQQLTAITFKMAAAERRNCVRI